MLTVVGDDIIDIMDGLGDQPMSQAPLIIIIIKTPFMVILIGSEVFSIKTRYCRRGDLT